MPKLPNSTVKSVNESESQGALMPDGVYRMRLREVEASKNNGPSGFPYWTWTFEVPEDADEFKKRRQWLTTSLSDKAAFKLKETFDAFGATPDTDTDELIGQYVDVVVGSRTIQKGARTGELANTVEKVLPDGGDRIGGSPDDELPF